MTAVPLYPHDLFTDEVLASPEEHYRAMRHLGPVVRLEAHDMYVLPRYKQVREALRDPATFCSGQGVGLNDLINEQSVGTTLMTDGPLHDTLRRLEFGSLTPKALNSIRQSVQQTADSLVEALVVRGTFDGVADLARSLPVTVVPALLGWPNIDEDQLLSWAAAAFDVLGPFNARAAAAVPRLMEMAKFAARVAESGAITPGSVASRVVEAAKRGDIPHEQVPSSLLDYLAPSMDTTISAVGSAIWLFSEHPEQWQAVRDNPNLIQQAFNEVLRLETPIRCFSRVTTREVEFDGYTMPAGARVIVHYASANRDERRFADPERFDIERKDCNTHLAFGIGTHTCPGQSLARIEVNSLLTALVQRVDSISPAGPPRRVVSNLINGWAELPVKVTPRTSGTSSTPAPAAPGYQDPTADISWPARSW